jgi:energy-coupling factor transporter ATP-binding protein EcfA2
MQTGQEPIRTGTGALITLVKYQPPANRVTVKLDENGQVVCPYQGLKAFTANKREFFFGRKELVAKIKQKLDEKPFVAVIGASGSGKSSVMLAGLIPSLEQERGWHILNTIQPTTKPLIELRETLKQKFFPDSEDSEKLDSYIDDKPEGLRSLIENLPESQRFLLVVDQFEEVFTLFPKDKQKEQKQEADRERFIKLITQVADISNSRLAIVITMRADFLEPCLKYYSLTQLIQTQAIYMPPLVGADLEQAIIEPAKRQGYTFEPGLLGEILKNYDLESLPLLEFVLTKLWEEAQKSQITQLNLTQYKARFILIKITTRTCPHRNERQKSKNGLSVFS